MERVLNELVQRLKKAYDGRLVSVILYGSAAVGEVHKGFSDINVLCVLEEVSARELEAAEDIFRWWQKLGNPSPLLLSRREVETSTDCFPIEFHDIRERHRVLYGEDVVRDLVVDERFYRAEVEHELRAKLLRLRQRGACVLKEKDLLLRLMAESVSTFCVLIRHALRLNGVAVGHSKREIVARARETFGVESGPLEALLDYREGKKKAKEIEARPLFDNYLKQIQRVVEVVDRLDT